MELGKSRPEPKTFRLRVRDTHGKGSDFQVCTADTVLDFKAVLEAAHGTPSKDQRLLCKGAVMVEGRTLGSYGLDDGHVIVSAPQLSLRHGSGINGGVAWGQKRNAGPTQPFDTRRGVLMVPGYCERWRPQDAGKPTPDESAAFFDSKMLPEWRDIHSVDYTHPVAEIEIN
eukprot:TRINITY_DN32127_c0_g2_i1.p1 TRINITY_DN32127_c0_g2~~TRINITY_DN32127_c0_g2_i1.p1  ORF type:complete len:171 (+),score=23.06 TRINITY_DN32127_c0_g2_i1:128-640(+)